MILVVDIPEREPSHLEMQLQILDNFWILGWRIVIECVSVFIF